MRCLVLQRSCSCRLLAGKLIPNGRFGEQLLIGGNILVEVLNISCEQVRLGNARRAKSAGEICSIEATGVPNPLNGDCFRDWSAATLQPSGKEAVTHCRFSAACQRPAGAILRASNPLTEVSGQARRHSSSDAATVVPLISGLMSNSSNLTAGRST